MALTKRGDKRCGDSRRICWNKILEREIGTKFQLVDEVLHMRDSPAKRKRILQAAAALFIKNGRDGTTLVMVGKASRAAVGSITNFFGNKAQLAAAVHDDVADRLVADAKAALRGHGNNVEAAIRALLSACLKWVERFPHHWRLIGMLEAYSSEQVQIPKRVQDRLAQVLAGWAEPLVPKSIARLSPSQLYAVILVPSMCAITPAASPASDDYKGSIDWLGVLTAAALAAISPQNNKPSRTLKEGSHVGARRRPHASKQRETKQGKFDL
ncbi:MAG: TetR/AcrR family transcriptional regulator [Alphaproteobacteria bacterium]